MKMKLVDWKCGQWQSTRPVMDEALGSNPTPRKGRGGSRKRRRERKGGDKDTKGGKRECLTRRA